MAVPTPWDATVYLGETSWEAEAIAEAYDAEVAAQQRACRISTDSEGELDYPADLVEALYRRVAHNLALRALPLGVQAPLEGAPGARVGGTDAEVRRLEAPHRRLIAG